MLQNNFHMPLPAQWNDRPMSPTGDHAETSMSIDNVDWDSILKMSTNTDDAFDVNASFGNRILSPVAKSK